MIQAMVTVTQYYHYYVFYHTIEFKIETMVALSGAETNAFR